MRARGGIRLHAVFIPERRIPAAPGEEADQERTKMTTIDLFRNAEETEAYPAGHVIFREGDPGHTMYAVQEGEVDLVVHGNVVETVGAGGIFGEMSLLLEGHRRSAAAIAKTDCRLAPVTEKRFNFLVQQTPNFALQVMRIIADRLIRMDARL